MKLRHLALLGTLIVFAGVALLGACTSLPPLQREESAALLDTAGTRLGRAIAPRAAAHPRLAGVYALPDPVDAFAARMLLADAADVSLDIQYYIWNADTTGILLFDALYRAAQRGVRVRLLLDDNNTPGLDDTLARLDGHPRIEVRLFNPFVVRWPRWIGYVTDFARINRRMHNKSFTADSQATVIGGRNIGDEYFAAADGVLFADLDVLAVGPVVRDVSEDFDHYWNSASAYPVHLLLEVPSGTGKPAPLAVRNPATAAYLAAVRKTAFVTELLGGTLAFEWAPTRMVSDDPAKGLGQAAPEATLMYQLTQAVGEPQAELDLVSPYFVPTASGVEAFNELAQRGVQIRILINSLEATDVDLVHAGYVRRREPLLRGGVTLFESKLQAPVTSSSRRVGPFGSSASSLHAKTFAVDRRRIFIGSFNFDPRSANLNTELGFVIDSPVLAWHMAELFETRVPEIAYQPRLSADGELFWIEQSHDEAVRYETEPRTTFWQRAFVWFASLLPIEWLL